MPYSMRITESDEKNIAKAYAKDVNVSYKHCNELCYAIKGMKVKKAEKFLEDVSSHKVFLPMRRYKKKIGHKAGGKIGQYPEKAVNVVQKLLGSAVANAEFRGLNEEKLHVWHATAYKAAVVPRGKPRGRWKAHNIELTNIEMILRGSK
ncbi:50S ribosomal protein L22 [archaeon]|nr:50S ribosomal protein L22 [archaeon]